MIRLIVLAVITLLVLLLGSIVIAWLFVIIGDGWEYRNEKGGKEMKEEWKVFIRGVEGRGDKVGKEVSNG